MDANKVDMTMDRRKFLGGAAALGALAMGSGMMAGCAPASSASGTGSGVQTTETRGTAQKISKAAMIGLMATLPMRPSQSTRAPSARPSSAISLCAAPALPVWPLLHLLSSRG